MNKNDLSLVVEGNNKLTISANKPIYYDKSGNPVYDIGRTNDDEYIFKERKTGKLQRVFYFPMNCDVSKASVSASDGVVTLRFPKIRYVI